MENIDISIFLNFRNVLSYNAFLTLLVTERGLGKSYGAKEYVVDHFIKKHKQFVYIRRYKTELQEAMMKNGNPIFFDQIKKIDRFKKHKLTNKKDTMYIDDKLCGFAIPLSTSNILKSSSYENVDTIIFDEFIIDPNSSSYHYLKDEITAFLELVETVSRLRNVKIILLGNALSITNPYFTYFNVTLPYNSETKIIRKNKKGEPLILLYYAQNEKYRKVKKETNFGQLIEGTEYGKYAIDNNFLRDSKSFIKKKTKNCKFFFTLILNSKKYGVWNDYQENLMFISYDYDPNCPIIFSLNYNDHNENTMLIRGRSSPFFKSIVEHYRIARLCFESQQIKNTIMQYIVKYLTY